MTHRHSRKLRPASAAGLLGAALLASPAALAAQPPGSQAVDEALRRGSALVQEGHFAEAIPQLEEADQFAGGRSAAARVALARAYAGAGAHVKAQAKARAALDLEPTGVIADEAYVLICQNRPETVEVAAGDPPRKVEGAVTRPRILFRVGPQYPPDLRESHAEGTVILEAILDEDGCISSAQVVRGAAPEFDEAALAAVRQWVFHPATVDGQPVKVRYTLTVNFTTEKEPVPKPGAEREPE
jgi:TonB family protein